LLVLGTCRLIGCCWPRWRTCCHGSGARHSWSRRALGFTQELFAPGPDGGPGTDVAAIRRGQLADEYPYIIEIAVIESGNHDKDTTHGWCDDQVEFEIGLDLLIDGLEQLHTAAPE